MVGVVPMDVTLATAYRDFDGVPPFSLQTVYTAIQRGDYTGLVRSVGGFFVVNADEFREWLRQAKPRKRGRKPARNTAPRSGSPKEKRQTGLALGRESVIDATPLYVA